MSIHLLYTGAVVLGLMFTSLVHGENRREPAAVTLLPQKNQQISFMLFSSGEMGPVKDLPAVLKKNRYDRVDISSWTRGTDYTDILASLKAAGIQVTRCYYLRKGHRDWDRGNLAEFVPEKTALAPLVYHKKFIEDNAYNRRRKLPGPFRKINYVTIHNTAEPFSAMQERDRVDFRRDHQSVSFHYAVDETSVVQLIPLKIHAWHAGDGSEGTGNCESIGVEICRSQCRDQVSWMYERSEAHAKILAAALLRHFKLPLANLKMHKDWSGKFCPHRILEKDNFEEFRAEVGRRLASAPDAEEQTVLDALKDE